VLSQNPGDMLAITAMMFYLASYSLVNIGSFGLISKLEKNAEKIVYVDDLKGVAKSNPMLALVFTVFMLSLAGIPPLMGFFGKLYLFSSALQHGFYWVAVWGVLGSVISVFYYLKPVVKMYMQEAEHEPAFERQDLNLLGLSICFVLVLVFGILSSKVLDSIYLQ